MSQWQKYTDLAATVEPGDADRLQAAGTYANQQETPETTDEQWAEAFWNAWHSIADDAAGGAR